MRLLGPTIFVGLGLGLEGKEGNCALAGEDIKITSRNKLNEPRCLLSHLFVPPLLSSASKFHTLAEK